MEKNISAAGQGWKRLNIGTSNNGEPVALTRATRWNKKTKMLVQSPGQTADYEILSKNEHA
jgi:hypothetical protein